MSSTITGWKLDPDDRSALLAYFPPRYERTVADHITLRFGTDESTALPLARKGEVIGLSDDGQGVEALVVSIEGTTERGDGSHFHITWSLSQKRHAKESNDLIARQGWKSIGTTIPVSLIPSTWSR